MPSERAMPPPSTHRTPGAHTVLIAALTVGLIGCHSRERTAVDRSAVQAYPAAFDQLDFVERLRDLDIVSNADALHALLLFAGDARSTGAWDDEVSAARDRGWLAPDVELTPEESAAVGMIMTAIERISDLGLGAAGLFVGESAWSPGSVVGIAATKRGRRLGLLPDRSSNQALSGAELLALLRRAEIYERAASGAPDDALPGG